MKIKNYKTKIARISVLLLIFALAAWGQDDVAPADTAAAVNDSTAIAENVSIDTAVVTDADDVDDSVDFAAAEVEEAADPDADVDDELDFAEYAAEDSLSSEEQKRLGVVRRDHSYKRQVKLAIIMMTFIIVAIATAQSWNPN